MKKTTYKNYEIIIIENSSSERQTFEYYKELSEIRNISIIHWDNQFNFSAVNNFGAKHATGEILLFLNNDTEVLNNDWMERMLEHGVRKEVGAVGAKLCYPNETIQHAGVVIGMGGIAGHPHLYYPKDAPGYMGKLQVIRNLSAVTGACLMTRKEIFDGVNGFDEGYPLAFNDVDLCLKILEKGYLIIWTPYSELYHNESKSRGREDTPEKQARFRREIELFRQKWGHLLEKGDPYYNPNLTLDREDFSIRI